MKLCVCVRSFLENPYLDFFIEYYILLGFDKILILKSDTEPYSCNPKYEKYVNIINVNNSGNRILQENIHYIQNTGCDWTFFPDVDEVLILHKQYKNIREFTERKVREYPDINMFYFRWGVIEKYDIEANNSFNDIVNDYNIFACRFIKSMVRTSCIKLLHDPHSCKINKNSIIYLEGSIINNNVSVHDIKEHSYNKDAVLIHIHTRSIHNIIIKSLYTVLNSKHILSLSDFINYINNFTEDKNIVLSFKTMIGQKAKLPFHHSSHEHISNIDITNYQILDCVNRVINVEKEKELVLSILSKNNIDEEKYYIFVNALNKEIKENHRRFYK